MFIYIEWDKYIAWEGEEEKEEEDGVGGVEVVGEERWRGGEEVGEERGGAREEVGGERGGEGLEEGGEKRGGGGVEEVGEEEKIMISYCLSLSLSI